MLSLPDLPRDDERLLRLGELPTGIEAALVPVRATLHEAVNQGFTLVLELLAAPSPQGLRALVGEALTLRLKQADGRYTPWHGCVAEAARIGRVGALVRWRLLLRPWLSWLALRQDSFVYQDRTALQIVESVFGDYPGARWRIACGEASLQAMRVRELCIQYRESDLAFVTRLLEQEGLHWHFEHVDESGGAGGSAAARHVLVIADARHRGPDLGLVRFAAQHPSAFLAVLDGVPLVPRAPRRPMAPAVLGARVVGQRGGALTSDRDHRVKVQFHFQRGLAPNPGGLAHVSRANPDGHAPGDARCGAWLRVLSPAAGAGWGSVYTPRVGAEVAIEFLDGDIDRPVVAGSIYHGNEPPPFAAGCDSGVNHAGALSGLHSRGLGGDGFNQWVLDDSTGQLRMRLHSSAARSELGLGHLIQQGPQDAWRGAWRGSGFEGCTQGWASVRAGAGLLLSTQLRPGRYGSAQGNQMDAAEALAQLRAARELAQCLGAAARAVQAPGLRGADDGQCMARFIDVTDPARQGRHPAQVNGQPALQAAADGRDAGTQPVPAFAEPVLLLDTPAAALMASEASVSAWSGCSQGLVAQGDLHLAAVGTYAQAGGGTAGVYAHQGGITVRAAHGPVSLRAHTDTPRLLADQSLTVTSVEGELRISAQQRVRLVAGSSVLTLDGADIELATPGSFTVRGATHEFLGGGRGEASLPELPR